MNLEEYEKINQLLRREIIRNLYKPIILTEEEIEDKLRDSVWVVDRVKEN